MATSLPPVLRERYPVAHTVAGQAIQTIQGLYYVIAGVGTALLVPMFQLEMGPSFDLADVWVVRVIGLVVAAFGALLVASGRWKDGPFIRADVAMGVALVLLVAGTVCLTFGALPPLFLVDVGIELGFVCAWAAAILGLFTTVFDG